MAPLLSLGGGGADTVTNLIVFEKQRAFSRITFQKRENELRSRPTPYRILTRHFFRNKSEPAGGIQRWFPQGSTRFRIETIKKSLTYFIDERGRKRLVDNGSLKNYIDPSVVHPSVTRYRENFVV